MSKFTVKLQFDYDEVRSMPLDVFRNRLTKMLQRALPKAVQAVSSMRIDPTKIVKEIIQEWEGR